MSPMKIREKWRKTTIGRSARIFSRRDQRRIFAVIILQICLGFLDLIGVAIIGILGALAISGIQSGIPGNRVTAALNLLHLENQSFQAQAAILGLGAAVILIGRTLLSVFFTRKTLFFLSRRGAIISSDLVSKLLSQSLEKIQGRTNQETIYAVTYGVTTITLGILGTTVALISDTSLMIVLAVGLFIVDPTIAFATFLIFSILGLVMYRLMNVRAKYLGIKNWELSLKGDEKIVEVLNSYREIIVRNRREYYVRMIGQTRMELANVMAEIQFMPNISKYVIESAVVLGALLISAAQFLMQDAKHAVATLAVFLASGTRIAPAILRIQQGTIQIRNSLGAATPTLQLIESLTNTNSAHSVTDNVITDHENFAGKVKITNLTLFYPNKLDPALKNIDLAFNHGESIAIVGPSGAGKTSLVDVLLGVLEPQEGSVEISGLPPIQAIMKWPGAISYVPQDVYISKGSIRENVALGYPVEVATDTLVDSALEIAYLDSFVRTLPDGIDTQVGERGTKISGGQRQRLGIARAMFTKPSMLVLDEATSALDGESEANISEAIQGLKGSVTVVMIAHRLSTVRNADLVVYMESGKILAIGTFEQVRNLVPDFDKQAKLMGL
jgi:ABC-type multidrug transport system fused ATPase/permease subunit